MGHLPAQTGPRRASGADPAAGGGARARSNRGGAPALILERVVRPSGPYSLALCTRHCGDATRRVRDGTLRMALRTGDGIELASARQLVDGRMVLQAESETGLERLRFSLAIDDDHSEF